MSIDLERFPWSDSANRMLTYVTKDWYDKSYVGKWIYEVMGRELDLATLQNFHTRCLSIQLHGGLNIMRSSMDCP